MDTFILAITSPFIAYAAAIAVGLVVLILTWIIHPYTVGQLTQFTESPLSQFFTRVVSTITWAGIAAYFMFLFLTDKGTSIEVPGLSTSPVAEETDAPPITDTPPVTQREKPSTTQTELPEQANKKPAIKDTHQQPPKPVTAPRAKPPKPSDGDIAKSDTNNIQLKIADLKGKLAVVDAKIESERTRWKNASAVINKLTNFKRTPVREGSPQYYKCLAASKIIKEVEAGAPALKAEKAKLKAMIKSLEGK